MLDNTDTHIHVRSKYPTPDSYEHESKHRKDTSMLKMLTGVSVGLYNIGASTDIVLSEDTCDHIVEARAGEGRC